MSRRSSTPEQLDWRPRPTPLQRFRRALTAPLLAAAVLFIGILLFSIGTVAFRAHSLTADTQLEAIKAEQNSESADSTVNTSETPPQPVVVHVVGEVNEPGVYELESGDRVSAALDAAGGPTGDAVLSGINLARPLVDGEQLLVPSAEQLESGQASTTSPEAQGGGTLGLINVNTADASALQSLPRIGPALAQRIIDWRTTNGGFSSADQLLEVSGIGRSTLEQLLPLITV